MLSDRERANSHIPREKFSRNHIPFHRSVIIKIHFSIFEHPSNRTKTRKTTTTTTTKFIRSFIELHPILLFFYSRIKTRILFVELSRVCTFSVSLSLTHCLYFLMLISIEYIYWPFRLSHKWFILQTAFTYSKTCWCPISNHIKIHFNLDDLPTFFLSLSLYFSLFL